MRTVLGRVLGCLPGFVSMCGWIGPCPLVEFDPPPREKMLCHVRLKARPVVPVISTDDDVIYVGTRFYKYTRIQPGGIGGLSGADGKLGQLGHTSTTHKGEHRLYQRHLPQKNASRGESSYQ